MCRHRYIEMSRYALPPLGRGSESETIAHVFEGVGVVQFFQCRKCMERVAYSTKRGEFYDRVLSVWNDYGLLPLTSETLVHSMRRAESGEVRLVGVAYGAS